MLTKKHANLCPFEERKINAFFELKEIEPAELLKLFEPSGGYSDFVRICRIPGRAVCTSGQDGNCSDCVIAQKFENPE